MKVRELIAALQALPQEADVYISVPADEWNTTGSEDVPNPMFDESSLRTYNSGGELSYPHGRVKL